MPADIDTCEIKRPVQNHQVGGGAFADAADPVQEAA